MFNINIITQLLGFFVLAALVNHLNPMKLLAMLTIFIIAILVAKTPHFVSSVLRFKWLLLVIIVIFAFNTPGEHLAAWPFLISPTYEGIVSGVTQVLRITVMLAALSLIMAANTKQQLIAGFYFILSPLRVFGLEVERFAARLWLTLHYVESQKDQHAKEDFLHRFNNLATIKTSPVNENVTISLARPNFGVMDYLLMLSLALFLVGLVAEVVW